MNAPVRTRRKNGFNLFREAAKLSSFDEFPMLRPEVDPQIHLSRNDVDQPFHLICEKDTVIGQFSGESRVEFVDGPVRYFDLAAGDFTYVPAAAAHRVRTVTPGVMLRYKAREPGNETILWLCDSCRGELGRYDVNATAQPVQLGYQAASEKYNAELAGKDCPTCGTVAPPVDLAHFRWQAVAEKLAESEED